MYKCVQQKCYFLRSQYNQQKVETTPELSSVPVRRLKFRARFTQLNANFTADIPLVYNMEISDISVKIK